MTMLDFPPEIWLQIANYIPPSSLQSMRTLNHALYEAAMDERYRRVFLSSHDEDAIRKLEHIRSVEKSPQFGPNYNINAT